MEGEADDGREVQVAKIDLMIDGEGASPLPGQVPLTSEPPDDAEPEFRQPKSRGALEEDQIQLSEEPALNYVYGEELLLLRRTDLSSSLSLSLSLSLSPLLSPVPNRGIVLWIQQLVAMFLKRFHNFKRFYGAVVTQLILPLLFVLFSMIIAVTQPSNSSDDPARSINLNNSALANDNITIFTAQFGSLGLTDSDALNFSVCVS